MLVSCSAQHHAHLPGKAAMGPVPPECSTALAPSCAEAAYKNRLLPLFAWVINSPCCFKNWSTVLCLNMNQHFCLPFRVHFSLKMQWRDGFRKNCEDVDSKCKIKNRLAFHKVGFQLYLVPIKVALDTILTYLIGGFQGTMKIKHQQQFGVGSGGWKPEPIHEASKLSYKLNQLRNQLDLVLKCNVSISVAQHGEEVWCVGVMNETKKMVVPLEGRVTASAAWPSLQALGGCTSTSATFLMQSI